MNLILVGCDSGQPGLVVGDPAYCRGLEIRDPWGPFQPKPFYDSRIQGFQDSGNSRAQNT